MTQETKRPTIDELETILSKGNPDKVSFNPDGSITTGIPTQPPYDNAHVSPGCAQFTKDFIDSEVIADKGVRVDLDKVLQGLKSLNPSRERALAVTKLQEAIMWLGMDLKRLNEPNPYPNSYKPENAIVDKTADGLKL